MSCGKDCEEGLAKVKLKQEGEESWEGRVGCEQKIRGARWLKFEVALAVGVWGERAGGGAGIP